MGDLRLGEHWGLRQRVRNEIFHALAMATLWGARRLPPQRLRALGRRLGIVAWACLGAHRRTAEQRLREAFGAVPPVSARAVFEGLGEDLADVVRLADRREPVDATLTLAPDTEATLCEAMRAGRGVVFTTAHLGPMDRMAALVASRGFPVVTVARESYDPRFTALYDRIRGGRNIRTVYRRRPGAVRRLIEALHQGCLVGFPMDLAGREMTCVPCDFLGRQSDLPVGPARLALTMRASVVAGSPERGPDGEMRVTVEPLSVTGVDGRPVGEIELTQRIACALDRRIRALPEHWPWMHHCATASVRRGPRGGRLVEPTIRHCPKDQL